MESLVGTAFGLLKVHGAVLKTITRVMSTLDEAIISTHELSKCGSAGPSQTGLLLSMGSQRLPHPLIKESSLHHTRKTLIL